MEPRVRCAPAAVTRPKVSPTLARSVCCSCWPHDRETLSGKALSAAPGVVSRCGLWSIESDIRQACRRMAAGDVALPGIGQWMPADYGQLNFKPPQNLNSSDQANRGRANQSRQRASAQIIYWRASSQENFPHPTHNTDCCCCSLPRCLLPALLDPIHGNNRLVIKRSCEASDSPFLTSFLQLHPPATPHALDDRLSPYYGRAD